MMECRKSTWNCMKKKKSKLQDWSKGQANLVRKARIFIFYCFAQFGAWILFRPKKFDQQQADIDSFPVFQKEKEPGFSRK